MNLSNSVRVASAAFLGIAALCVASKPANALADYTVQVGYADGLRGAGFFPNPWNGDAGVTFVGTPGASPDAGAIRIINNSATPLTINDVSATVGANTFDLWGSNVLGAGDSLILTQTAYYNFDTSDFSNTGCGTSDGVIPTVTVTENGTPTIFNDTGEVLNTNGYDFACVGNESFQWRTIGTNGTPAGTGAPEPAAFASFGIGVIGLALLSIRELRRKSMSV